MNICHSRAPFDKGTCNCANPSGRQVLRFVTSPHWRTVPTEAARVRCSVRLRLERLRPSRLCFYTGRAPSIAPGSLGARQTPDANATIPSSHIPTFFKFNFFNKVRGAPRRASASATTPSSWISLSPFKLKHSNAGSPSSRIRSAKARVPSRPIPQ